MAKIIFSAALWLAYFAAIFSLSGCEKEDVVLTEFKSSQAAKVAAQCAGATGTVAWKRIKTEADINQDITVIQAILTKNGKELEVRWQYNTSTKVSELEYAGKSGGKTTPLQMGLDLGLFCG